MPFSAVSRRVSKRSIWLGDAAASEAALPPTIQRIAGARLDGRDCHFLYNSINCRCALNPCQTPTRPHRSATGIAADEREAFMPQHDREQ
jgi:hypothetical protein